MALTRRGMNRMSGSIWPGFVDAMTALLLVLMFVLTIFMIMQFMLRETISGQETELDELSGEVSALADALGLERERAAALETTADAREQALAVAGERARAQDRLIASLTGQLSAAENDLGSAQDRIASFEDRVASLLDQRDDARAQGEALAADLADSEAARDALDTALAAARSEVDAAAETARLAAARREALDALVADLRARNAEQETQLTEAEAEQARLAEELSAEERAKLAETAAAQALRERLAGAEDELTAMTLALEEQRRGAEETLTLLAAARRAEDDLDARLAAALTARDTAQEVAGTVEGLQEQIARLTAENDALRAEVGDVAEVREKLAAAVAARADAELTAEQRLSEAEERAALLAVANAELGRVEARSAEAERKLALLNEQVAALRGQLQALQDTLDIAASEDQAAQVQIESLGSQLNAALARAAAEQRRRAMLEEAERRRLEDEARNLENYRSEFFGRLRDLLGNQEGVRIVGDRFVFSSEVLFPPGQADLTGAGRAEIANVSDLLLTIASEIPEGIDWIIRVDGHTDNVPLSGQGEFADNWELSQARALSVVRYMSDVEGIPPQRLSANGFGEYQPVNPADTEAARAQNRRIELKLTER
ncbi:MAG: peptidoglycan -binding protein [Celeribacter sp.]